MTHICDIEDSERVVECMSCSRMMPVHQVVVCTNCASAFCLVCADLKNPDVVVNKCINCRKA